MPKIGVMLWHWGRRGGGPRYTLELARALATDPAIELHLSLSRQSELFDESQSLGLPGFHVDTYSGKASAALSLLKLPEIRRNFGRYLSVNRIGVVNCTMSHVWNLVMLPALKAAGASYILTVHDAIPHLGENYMVRRWMLGREIGAADRVITLTLHVKGQVIGSHGYPEERCSVIPHGVFLYGRNQMRPRRAPKDGAYRMLFFGRLQPYKGLDILVGAYRKLREEFSEISLEIVGLGNVSEFLPGGLDVPGIRVDTRWVPEAELGEVFDRADLLITPYTEASQSGAVAVAMGVGMPVVATPVGGLLEQVGHRQSGLIARAVSEEAVAEAVRELIQNPALYESCSLSAVKQVQEKFAWDVIGRQVASVIHSFAGTSSSARPVFAVARNGKTEFDGVGPSRGTRNGADEGI